MIAALLGHADKQVRDAAARTLSSMGTGVIPLLQGIRASSTRRARPAALYFLAEVGGEQALSDRDRHAIERLSRVKLLTGHPEPVTGCFLSCIAVRSDDRRAVTDLFRLTPTCPATFTLGTIAADCDGHYRLDARRYARVFVTPSLDGWTLLVGPWCDPASQERRDEVLELRLRASAAFGSAQAYRYGERGDGSAWLVTENGTLIRRACNFGSATDEVLLLGPPLPAEIELPAA